MGKTSTQITSYLVEKGLIQKEDLEKVLSSNQPIESLPLEDFLVHAGLITEEEVRLALEEFFGTPFATPADFPQEPLLINNLSTQFMKESKFIPSRLEDGVLTIIVVNPLDFYTLDAIRLATNHEIRALAGREDEILAAIERFYGSGATSMEKIIEDIESKPEYQTEVEENIDHLRDMASEGPVIRLEAISRRWSIFSSTSVWYSGL